MYGNIGYKILMTCELFFWGKKLSRDFFIFYRDLKAISRTIQMVLEQKDFLYQEKLVKVTLLNFFRFVRRSLSNAVPRAENITA